MITLLVILTATVIVSIVGTVVTTARDGYRRVPAI